MMQQRQILGSLIVSITVLIAADASVSVELNATNQTFAACNSLPGFFMGMEVEYKRS